MDPVPDYVGSAGESYGLAQRIIVYWRARGYAGCKPKVLNLGSPEFPIWSVRSNIGPDGYPPKEKVG
jgi:hypothetical protein